MRKSFCAAAFLLLLLLVLCVWAMFAAPVWAGEAQESPDGVPAELTVQTAQEDSQLPDQLENVRLTTVKRSGGSLVLKWKAVPGAEGYEVEYGRNALWNPAKTVTVKSGKTNLSLKVKEPQTYCVRVRAFAGKGDSKVWSPGWTSSMMTRSAVAKVSYLKRGSSRLDIRKDAGKALLYHDISEGACSDGKYIYICMEYRTRDKAGNKTVEIRIAKVRLSDRKLVKISKTLNIGHANSLVYNSRSKKLVATGFKKKDPYVRLIDPKTLKVVRKVYVNTSAFGDKPEGFNALGYDPDTDCYMIRARDYYGYIYLLNSKFVAIKRMELEHNPETDIQGFGMEGDNFFLCQSRYQTTDKNTITIFDREGQKLQDIRLKINGELESVFRIGDEYYGTVHYKSEVSKADRREIKRIQKANKKKPKTKRQSVQPIYTKYRKTYIFKVIMP